MLLSPQRIVNHKFENNNNNDNNNNKCNSVTIPSSCNKRDMFIRKESVKYSKKGPESPIRKPRRLSTNKKGKQQQRNVKFNDDKLITAVIPVPRLCDISDEDHKNIWWTNDEFDLLTIEYKSVLYLMDHGESTHEESRGLEQRTEEGAYKYYENIKNALHAVLDEQDKQRRLRGDQPIIHPAQATAEVQSIAAIYMNETKDAVVDAIKRAKADAKEAKKYKLRRKKKKDDNDDGENDDNKQQATPALSPTKKKKDKILIPCNDQNAVKQLLQQQQSNHCTPSTTGRMKLSKQVSDDLIDEIVASKEGQNKKPHIVTRKNRKRSNGSNGSNSSDHRLQLPFLTPTKSRIQPVKLDLDSMKLNNNSTNPQTKAAAAAATPYLPNNNNNNVDSNASYYCRWTASDPSMNGSSNDTDCQTSALSRKMSSSLKMPMTPKRDSSDSTSNVTDRWSAITPSSTTCRRLLEGSTLLKSSVAAESGNYSKSKLLNNVRPTNATDSKFNPPVLEIEFVSKIKPSSLLGDDVHINNNNYDDDYDDDDSSSVSSIGYDSIGKIVNRSPIKTSKARVIVPAVAPMPSLSSPKKNTKDGLISISRHKRNVAAAAAAENQLSPKKNSSSHHNRKSDILSPKKNNNNNNSSHHRRSDTTLSSKKNSSHHRRLRDNNDELTSKKNSSSHHKRSGSKHKRKKDTENDDDGLTPLTSGHTRFDDQTKNKDLAPKTPISKKSPTKKSSSEHKKKYGTLSENENITIPYNGANEKGDEKPGKMQKTPRVPKKSLNDFLVDKGKDDKNNVARQKSCCVSLSDEDIATLRKQESVIFRGKKVKKEGNNIPDKKRTTKSGCKIVTFSNKTETLPTPQVKILEKDIYRRWYSKEEMSDIESSYGDVIDRMEKGNISTMIEDNINESIRGLEDRTDAGSWKLYERKRDALNIVLIEQEKQQRMKYTDYDKIAALYIKQTKQALEEAIQKGIDDAKEAKKYKLRRKK